MGQAAELPTGTLTLLFTDMEGSTRLLSRLGARYAEVVSGQREIMRAAFGRWGGREMGTEGDSFFVVFRSVSDAVCAAVEAQRGLAARKWPDDVAVRVRMGLHTGEPTPHEDGYVGMDVHRAARVAASAHGGQVVLSDASYRIAAGSPMEGVGFVGLGVHRLKDLPGPEHLFQVVADGLPTGFPPLKSLGSGTSLPRPATSLVCRDAEIAALGEVLRGPSTTVVTLTGPAGTGKTRLAIAVAADVDGRYADGVYFVSLASVNTADVMWTTVAEALGVTGESKAPPTFLEHLGQREVLLVLDNLEQLPDAAPVVAELVGAGPGVQVLATSRRPLHLSGEHEFPVPTLPVPAAGSEGAVDLFVRRARLVQPGFELTGENVEDIREICLRLDGLPLAIELVAARVKLLGPRALRSRLDQALGVSAGAVDIPERQQNLRSALAWSHRLLPADQQVAFRRLGVLDGAFDLPAAAAVLATDGDELDLVGALVDASLLGTREGPDGEPRFRMLRTIALYARELLEASDEGEATHERHAEHYAGLALQWCGQLRTAHHLTARSRIEAELENMRAALGWALQPSGQGVPPARLALGLRLCEQLSWFWYGCGYQAEGRRWLQTAVDAAAGSETPEAMSAVHGLGVLLLQQGEADRARELLEVCLDHWRRDGDLAAVSGELSSLAMAYRALDDAARARELVEEAVAAARESGDAAREANATSNLAALLIDEGDVDPAIELLERTLVLDTQLQDAWGQAADHVNLAGAMLRAGRTEDAYRHLAENAEAGVALGDVDITVDIIGLLCAAHAQRRDAGRTARLLGTSQTMREQAELPLPPQDAAWLDGVVDLVRDQPDPETWRRQVAVGSGYSVEDALRDGLTQDDTRQAADGTTTAPSSVG